jgi:vacuolar-type H+-ATPase subunit D/Vma8
MWLNRRLAVATRGANLLDQKLRILMAEEQGFALLAGRTQGEWEAAVRDLDRWMLRGVLLSGERGLRLASGGDAADVEVEWRQTMGVRYPAGFACHLPERAPTDPLPANTALVHAAEASRRAVRAGVDHAVATTALSAVRTEIVSTRRQLRAVRDRWTPKLESARRELTVALDDQEHDDGVRLRWAAAPTRGGAVRP